MLLLDWPASSRFRGRHSGRSNSPPPPRSRSSAPSACKRALEELAPKFEKATGHKLTITWGTAALLVKRVQAGESADL